MDNNIEVFFGPVDDDVAKELLQLVTSTEFPWYYLEDTTYERTNKVSSKTPAWAHLLFGNDGTRSPFLDKFTPVLNGVLDKANLKLNDVIRMRLGFLANTRYSFPSQPYAHNEPHQDAEFPHYTAVWYLNEADGDLVIFNETEPSDTYTVLRKELPEYNKVVLFNGLHYHASTCPKLLTKRIALTMNFTAEQK